MVHEAVVPSLIAEEQLDYGNTPPPEAPEEPAVTSPMEIERAKFKSLDFMPEGCEGRAFPLFLADKGKQAWCEFYDKLPAVARPYLDAAVNPEAYVKRVETFFPGDIDRLMSVRHQIAVATLLMELPSAMPDLLISMRDAIHSRKTADPYRCEIWIALACIALDYSHTVGSTDALGALQMISAANELGGNEIWPGFENVPVVPALAGDLQWTPQPYDPAGWVRVSDIRAGNILVQRGYESVSPRLLAADYQIQFGSVPVSLCSSDQVVPVVSKELTCPGAQYAEDLVVVPRRSTRQAKKPGNADPTAPAPLSKRQAKKQAKAEAAAKHNADKPGPSGLPADNVGPSKKDKGKAAAKAAARPHRFLWQDSSSDSPAVSPKPVSVAQAEPAAVKYPASFDPAKVAPDWLFRPAVPYSPTADLPFPVRSRERSPVRSVQPRPAPYRPPFGTVATNKPVGLRDIRTTLRGGARSPVRTCFPPPLSAAATDAWVSQTLPMPTPCALTTSAVATGVPLAKASVEAPVDAQKVSDLYADLLLPRNEQELHAVIRWYLKFQPGGEHPPKLAALNLQEIKLLHGKLQAVIRLASGSFQPTAQVSFGFGRGERLLQQNGNHENPAAPVNPSPVLKAEPFSPNAAVDPTSSEVVILPAPPAVTVPVPVSSGMHAAPAGHGKVFMNGLKLPTPPTFNGSASNSNPKEVRHFVRGMQLLIRQSRIPDPVLYACNHLVGDAADWRDMDFLPAYPLEAIIPWADFESALMHRFVPTASCFEALSAFKQLAQRGKTVQEYNAVYRMRRAEISDLPHVDIPDLTSQISQYLKGLDSRVFGLLKTEFMSKSDMLSDLDALMTSAVQAELVLSKASLFRKDPAEQVVHTRVKATDSNNRLQKRNRDGQTKQGQHARSPRPATGRGVRGGGKPHRLQRVHSSLPAPPPAPEIKQWPGEKSLKGLVHSAKDLADLRSKSHLSVKGKDNKMYPNYSYRMYGRRDAEKAGKCFGCLDIHGKHDRGSCPNPEVRAPTAFHAAATLATEQLLENVPPVPEQVVSSVPAAEQDVQSSLLSALVSAQPYQGLTMLFTGAVHERSNQEVEVNILLDTGSTHNYARPGLSKDAVKRDSPQYSITLADNSQLHNVCEKQLSFECQGVSCKISACEMELPNSVDIILGQQWMQEHAAVLTIKEGHCRFRNDADMDSVWNTPAVVKSSPFNSSLLMTSAARICKSAKQVFVAYVRSCFPCGTDSRINAMTNAESQQVVAEGSLASAAAAPGDSGMLLDSLFVEQASAVDGVKQLVQQFAEVFPVSMPAGLPVDRGIAHTIPLIPNSTVPAAKTYRLSKPQREEMEGQIKALLSQGWIQPSSSPYGSPIIFVKKKDGGIRMCVDYRAVNKITVRNSYPLPRIDDMFDQLSGASLFSCLDLQQAYHQIRLNPADVSKTAFTTPLGLYEYLVLPFGLCNAPSTFQAVINSVIGQELRHCCLVYLDDIVVFSKSADEHLQHLQAVLSKLQQAKLYAKLSKCRFALQSIKFLGHVIDAQGIYPDPDKVQIVQDWPVPRNVSETRSFVGLAQYFRKFIQGFPTLIAPLTSLFKKDVAFVWTQKCQDAFEGCKKALTTAPCLKLPDCNEPFTVITDACGVGIGGVLMQSDRPIAFEGRKLTDAEKKWCTTEQEMLGVVYHLEKWRCYLEGVRFRVITDHQPNIYFQSMKTLSPRLARWYERISLFDFEWQYKPGRLNVADPLSRHPAFCNMLQAVAQPMQGVLAMNLRSTGAPADIPALPESANARKHWDMRQMLDSANAWKPAKKRLKHSMEAMHAPPVPTPMDIDTPARLPEAADCGDVVNMDVDVGVSAPRPPVKKSGKHTSKLAVPASQLKVNNSEYVPGPPPKLVGSHCERKGPVADIADCHIQNGSILNDACTSAAQSPPEEGRGPDLQKSEPDLGHVDSTADTIIDWNMNALQDQPSHVEGDAQPQTSLVQPELLIQSIQEGYHEDPLYSLAETDRRTALGITAVGNLFKKGDCICVPNASGLYRSIVRELHCSPYAGHLGMNKTHALIRRHYYWPNMQEQVHAFVRGCVVCQRNKAPVGKVAGKLLPLPVPTGIWEDVSMDFVGPLPKTARHADFILVVVDRLSKMAHFLPCKSNIDGMQTAQLYVDRIWSLHGLPKSVVTDRGTQFLNKFNTALCKLIGTKHNCSSAYHPESDGQTERINRMLGEMLRHFTNFKYTDWDLQLPLVEFAHNNAPTTATGMSPFFVCYGKHPLTPMSAVMRAANAEWEAEPSHIKTFLSANDFVRDRQAVVKKAQEAMEAARQRMMHQENHKRKLVTYEIGDQVSLKTKHLGINTLPSKKLFQPWMGPFTVSQVINESAYKLELPTHWRAHNVFHVSLLKPYISNGEAQDPQSFTLVGGQNDEFEIESISDYFPKTLHKDGKPRKVSELYFVVKWRGIPMGHHARQPFKNLKGSPHALADLAQSLNLPADQFSKGTNRMPDPSDAAGD